MAFAYSKQLAGLVIAVFSLSGHAEQKLDGNTLLSMIKRGGKTADMALAYVRGVAEAEGSVGAYINESKGYSVGPLLGDSPLPLICLPPGVKFDQALDMAANYLNAHPEDRHESAYILVRYALLEHWPCPKPSQSVLDKPKPQSP